MTDFRNNCSPIRLAFLGGGINSAVGRVHYSAAQLDGFFKLTAGCFSRDEVVNRETAVAYNIPEKNVRSSLSDLVKLHKLEFDAVVVLTPTSQHFGDVAFCLQNGIPVVCEKSLATSVEEAVSLQKLVQQQNGFLGITYNYTGYPMVRELRALIRRGDLGRIQQIMLEMPQEGFSKLNSAGAPITPQGWRLADGGIPTISLDLGAHLQMFVEFLVGETPESVVASSDSYGNFKQIEDTAFCIARYSSGMTCNFWYTKAALGYRNGMRIRLFGSEGSAEWLQIDPENLRLSDVYGERINRDRGSLQIIEANKPRYTRFKAGHPAGYIEAFANYYCDIANELGSYLEHDYRSSPFVFGVDSEVKSMRLMEAIHVSSKAKRWVSLDD